MVAQAEPEPAAPEPAAEPEPAATAEPEPATTAVPESAATAEPEPATTAVPESAVAAAPGSVAAEQTGRFAADSRSEPAVAAEAQAAAAAPVPVARPATEPAGAMDPVGGFAGVVAIAGAVFAVAGLPLNYRYDYSLTQYRPGMESAVLIVAACALLAGILTLTPRTRSSTGPALLSGTGLAALFGLLRFLGEAIALSQNGDTELKTGYTLELLAHIAWLVAGASAFGALRRSPAVALGAGPVRGWPAWAAIGLGVTAAIGWIVQLVDLNTYDSSDAGRATAYFLLGALLAVSVPVVAMALRPSPVGCAVLATGTAGLFGVLAPTFAAVAEASSLALGGQLIAVVALALLAADTIVLAVRARNQPNGRQS